MEKKILIYTGIFLLIPALISVVLFIGQTFGVDTLSNYSANNAWTGWVRSFGSSYSDGLSAAGFTSALPIYIGLMAIAGSLLLCKGLDKE